MVYAHTTDCFTSVSSAKSI